MSRRPDNAVALTPTDGTIVSVSLQQQMELYDALPLAFRILVDSAPIEQNVEQVYAVIHAHGEAAYDLICSLWEQNFPGWRRPTCD